ncbi:MAG TPA: hypothetical protein DCL08_02700 [Anaerolineaceae bacterium]|nr:hypothetical protein [Anaerolineaceae bacterium]
MKALVTIANILYLFWPLTMLFGLRKLFQKKYLFKDRIRLSLQRIFTGWLLMALLLGFIYLQDGQAFFLISEQTNHLLFGLLGLITGGITIIWALSRWRKNRIRLSDAQTLDDLLSLTPDEFEKLVATLFKAYGHQAQVLGGSSDHGVDVVVLSKDNEKWIVQCKRYNGSVGEPVLRDLYGTMGHEGAHKAYLITTGSFTSQAKDWAVGKPIVLYDGPSLVKLIQRTQLHRSQLRR